MSLQTTRGRSRRRGDFSFGTAALVAFAGLVIGIVLVQADSTRRGASEESAATVVTAPAPARNVTAPQGMALTGGEGFYFTERQIEAARAAPAQAEPPYGTAALTDGAGHYVTEQQLAAAREAEFACGARSGQIAC